MKIRLVPVALLALGVSVFGTEASGQTQSPPQSAPRPERFGTGNLRLFLDCQYECDTDFITKELTFVDHVRDSQSADIHALVTTQSTGGGGTSWKIQFIGMGRFAGYDESVTFATQQTATSDERRKEVLKWLKAGLATPAAIASGKANFEITMPKAADATPAEKPKDPWNAWVFNLNTNGHMSGEETSKFSSYRFSAGGSRVTDNWKMNFNANWNRSTNKFEISDSETVESISDSWNASGLVVKSLGPRWSFGGRYSVSGSTFSNYDYNARVMFGPEFDFFPYSESTRRSLTLSYMVGIAHYNFEEVTIFDKLKDTNPEHSIVAALGLRQPWGSVGGQAYFTQFLDDLSKSRLGFYGDADVRLFKGFSFNVFGDYSRIRDQINLRKSDVAEEEVLLRLRQLQTGYQYFMGFGVTYRFGSALNNVVNPRFRNY